MQNSGETQKALRGPRSQGVLTPYPFPTGKAALILFSQRICRPDGRGLPGPKSSPHLGALRSETDGQARDQSRGPRARSLLPHLQGRTRRTRMAGGKRLTPFSQLVNSRQSPAQNRCGQWLEPRRHCRSPPGCPCAPTETPGSGKRVHVNIPRPCLPLMQSPGVWSLRQGLLGQLAAVVRK